MGPHANKDDSYVKLAKQESSGDEFYDALEYHSTSEAEEEAFRKASPTSRVELDSLRGGASMSQRQPPVADVNGSNTVSSQTSSTTPPANAVPVRFLRAAKGDPVEGRRRYEETLTWRREHGMDTILSEAHPHFTLIKANWPHYYHFRGRKGEPVYFEKPPKMQLQPMRDEGLTMDTLLRHYAMVCEFMWQYVERSEDGKSIYVIDLDGMGFWDFVGEVVDFCKKTAGFTQAHFPERSGCIMVINVPSFFKLIWAVMKPLVDPVTLEKIYILRGKDEIREALVEKIPIENIPEEYGGTSVPLGEAPEERMFVDLMEHNNLVNSAEIAGQPRPCGGVDAQPPCQFCSFQPVPLGGSQFYSLQT